MPYGCAAYGSSYYGSGQVPQPIFVFIGSGKFTFPNIVMSGYGILIPITVYRKTIVMPLSSYAVSHYVNFNFNSLAHFKEVFLGANEDGVFILGGKDDLGQPIQADVRTGIHDFAKDGIKTLPKEAWMIYRTNGQLELDIEVEENASYPYVFEKTSQRITEARKKLAKGFKERFYRFTLKNLAGSDFDLDSFRILGNAINLKRR